LKEDREWFESGELEGDRGPWGVPPLTEISNLIFEF
jgi:hypothetical protein